MRFKHLEDYQPAPGAPGGYAYTGAWHVPTLKGRALRRRKAALSALCLLQLPLIYLMGRIDAPSFRQLYVILPFLLLIYFCGRALISALSLYLWRDMMTSREHDQSHKPLLHCLRAAPFAAGALLLTVILHLILGGDPAREWPLALLIPALVLLDLYTFKLAAGMGVIMQAQGKAPAGDPLLGPDSTINQD